MDQQTSKDGSPRGPQRFKELIEECWFISDNLNTSYTEILDLSIQERLHLKYCIEFKNKEMKKAMDKISQQAQK